MECPLSNRWPGIRLQYSVVADEPSHFVFSIGDSESTYVFREVKILLGEAIFDGTLKAVGNTDALLRIYVILVSFVSCEGMQQPNVLKTELFSLF